MLQKLPDVYDLYADSILKGKENSYDGIEIHGVRNTLTGFATVETCYEIDNKNPELFSVYVHQKQGGGIESVADSSDYESAEQYANELSHRYGWPISNYVSDAFPSIYSPTALQ